MLQKTEHCLAAAGLWLNCSKTITQIWDELRNLKSEFINIEESLRPIYLEIVTAIENKLKEHGVAKSDSPVVINRLFKAGAAAASESSEDASSAPFTTQSFSAAAASTAGEFYPDLEVRQDDYENHARALALRNSLRNANF